MRVMKERERGVNNKREKRKRERESSRGGRGNPRPCKLKDILESEEERDILGEIKIEDEELDERLEEMGEEKIMIYGEFNRELDEDEKSVLMLNPNMATYEAITRKGVRADIEEGFAKLRYSRLYNSQESEREDVELTQEERKRIEYIEAMQDEVYWPESKRVDMGNRRVRDIKVNKRVMLPDPRPAGEQH